MQFYELIDEFATEESSLIFKETKQFESVSV